MDKTAYFESRTALGKEFAQQLANFGNGDSAVLALSPGGAVMALEVARYTHSTVALLLLKHIYLPGEPKPLGVVNDQGALTYGLDISPAYIEDFEMEYHSVIETNKMEAVHELHAIGRSGRLSPHAFNDLNVIIVSDFSKTGTALKAAVDFLKPARTKKIIFAVAVAQPKAIDVMHLLGDKLLISHTTDKDLPPEHYFTENELPETEELEALKNQMPLQWWDLVV